jgi:hypothetical protein
MMPDPDIGLKKKADRPAMTDPGAMPFDCGFFVRRPTAL